MERRHFDEIKTQSQITKPTYAHQELIQLKTHPLVLEKHIYLILGAVFVLDMPDTWHFSNTFACISQPCPFLKIKKKKNIYIYIYILDTSGTQEQEESNTLLQNKKNTHALNNNIASKN